ncbi:hypothetical protein ACFYTS_19625 [Nocardia sp. NPDC004151]|uniref:hypothetical protein n=1 Tax=Nocardia sp. NPDC004151 TaxID=3364304 RepID=UPI0036C478CC
MAAPFTCEILDATHWIPEERPAELAALIAARAATARTGRPARVSLSDPGGAQRSS